MPGPTPLPRRKLWHRTCRSSCLVASGSTRSRRSGLRTQSQQSSWPGSRPGSARRTAVQSRKGCGEPQPCPGACGRRAKSGRGRQRGGPALSHLQRPLRRRRQERRQQPCPVSGCSRPRCRRCRPARLPCRQCSAAKFRRSASTISGRWALGLCQAQCRRRMAGCRAYGAAPGAAARPATPPGRRYWPVSRAAGPLGRLHPQCIPWSWKASTGDAAGVC